MSSRSVLNETYRGIVEEMAIPATLEERAGRPVARFGDVLPIHVCTPEEVAELSETTHHYCDIFTSQMLAPLEELVYVRLDEHKAEKVFINRHKRILVQSSDGALAAWRCAPTFESANLFVAGAPLVNKDGALVSVVTAKRGNHYAVSTFEGEGGYVETSEPWRVLEAAEGGAVYGERRFADGAALRAHVRGLPPARVGPGQPARPVLHRGPLARVVVLAANGRQLSHSYIQGVLSDDVQYL